MISVIIPALNEERTIGKVVQFVKKTQSVDEIIVVDDKSIDDTVQVAKDAGASVITSTKVGKGASMRDGFLVTKNEIIVFLDGDIENYPPETIEKLTAPVMKDEADLVKGKNIAHLLNVVEDIPIVPDAIDITKELKKRGYIVGIISDSYDCVANHIKNKIGADFALANELEFSQSIATGEIIIPSFFIKTDKSQCNHKFCKSNAMLQVADQYGIGLSNTIAVGDSEYDICMVRFAGIGVSFCSNNIVLNTIADQIIETKSFKPILDFAI